MTQNNNLNNVTFNCPEIREANCNMLVSRIHQHFPEVDAEVIKKVVNLVTDKEVMMNSGNPLETLPVIVELTLKNLFNIR